MELPPGLVAAPPSFPQCSHPEFLEDACPSSTAVGSIEIAITEALPAAPVFLLEPLQGTAAQLGFHVSNVPVTIDITIAPGPTYGLVASITNVSQAKELSGATLRLEGTPGGRAFLTLPRSCAAPLLTSVTATSWQDPAAAIVGNAPEPQSLGACGSLSYLPSLAIAPTTAAPATPSGIDLAFDAPDSGIDSAVDRAAADTESATVTLPPGLTLNPPVAAGLAVCTVAQLAAETADSEPGQGCPEAAKVGGASVTTPLFSKPIGGSVYLGLPEGAVGAISTGRSATRFALYLVLRDAERGVLVSLPLRVDADPRTGQLTASLDQIPPLPISHLDLHLNSGPRAPLTTGATCGSAAIAYSLTPSSGNPPLSGADPFSTAGPGCNAGFAPGLAAGTTSPAAGRSSPFVFELSQSAAAPNPSAFSITLPPGLSAAFGGVTPCPDDRAAGGDCPDGSKLGYARIALGSGPEPLWVPSGERPDSAVYLAGPYKGAPYSLVIAVPAQAGPFDLGAVVLRAPIAIDPVTAQASLSLEGLPQILDGVPLHYRAIRVVLDRPGFVRNPTSCEPTAIMGTARAADGSTSPISSRFQVGDCAALAFRPKLSLRLSGALWRNGHPALRAVLRTDPEGAALKSARFSLPEDELLDLKHVRALCPRTAAPAGCPPASRLGSARIYSPSLEAPLEGPIYLRVPSHRLPDLVAEVRSDGLHFLLRGRTTNSKGRLGVSLGALPDIPLSRAILNLAGGRRGILVNSHSLCRGIGAVTAHLAAHNGPHRRLRVRPLRPADCPAAAKRTRHSKIHD